MSKIRFLVILIIIGLFTALCYVIYAHISDGSTKQTYGSASFYALNMVSGEISNQTLQTVQNTVGAYTSTNLDWPSAATIQNNTYKKTFTDTGYVVNFILDIKQFPASYSISVTKGSDGTQSVSLSCVNATQSIYSTNDKCQEQYNGQMD